jgi:hypothetical protein
VESSDELKGVHGNNERISVENVGWALKFMVAVMEQVQ